MARKYSSEYKNLQPYVVEDIRKVVNATGAAGTSGGTLEQHGLNSWYHTGELAQSQASWAATKVELSNHAALPDVHHAKVHAITDAANHSVTGSQYQIVGLTAVNTLGLLTPSATPAANAVVKTDGSSGVTLVDLTVTSDLFMSGYLDFGTDVMYEDATYLQVTGSKAVRFGQNIGNANWTVFNTGGAQFGGNVDVVSGGDLTVAGSGAYAGNQVLFADSSGGNVGIMRAPDSQFALDINGPARATYWIGPHAIQLKNVLMLCHYDGRQPFATNYSGEPNGHMGQVATVSGGVIYRPGMWGTKAIQIADATTNRITNPSFEGSITGWSGYNSGTVALSQIYALYGQYSMLVGVASNGQGAGSSITGLAASTTYTLSAWVFLSVARSVTLHASDNIDTDMGSTVVSVPASTWTRLALSFVTDSHTTVYFQVTANGSTSMFVDGVQMEAKGSATPYCDGSLGDGHAWAGTAHASMSSRTASGLSYPTAGNINQYQLTFMAWVNPASINGVGQVVFRMSGSTAGHILLELDGTGKPRGYVGTASVTAGSAIPVNTWTHLAMIYDSGTLRLYVNGVYSNGGTSTGFVGIPAAMYVGNYAGAYFFNGLIDDLCILDRTMVIAADNSCSELRAIYESNAPVFAETSTFSFRPTPKGLIWADDEGLWMRDTAGKPVLGVYGGEAATKNWGGFNLVPGDLLLGNNAVGSSAIWWSRVSGTFGFYGAGSGTPQVEIATDGSLTAGAGNVALNAAGAYIITGSTPDNFLQAFSFKTAHAGAVVSSFQGYVDGSANDHGGIRVGRLSSGHDADVFVLANSLAGDISTGTFGSVNTSGSNYRSLIVTRADGSTANVQTYIDANVVATIDAKGINGKTIYSSGDSGGVASTVAITNDVQGTGAGTGTIKMNGATSRNSSGWLKIWYGTNAYYVPLFSTVTG